MKRKTKEQFVEDAQKVHGQKYDYSKVKYINSYTKVCIICPIHGEFWQTPNSHLKGRGCKICSKDIKVFTTLDRNLYRIWSHMKHRCNSKAYQKQRPTYIGCSICEEWNDFSNFKEWASDKYVEGWCLDKDILVKGNKVYSPMTCCFVPQRINTLFTKRQRERGDLPIGVARVGTRFRGEIQKEEKRIKLKSRYSIEEAFSDYKLAKEDYIKEIAIRYKSQLEPRVYEAMCNYKVEITD